FTPIWPTNSIHSSTARSGSFLRLSRGVSSWSAAVRTLSCMYSGLKSIPISSSLILDIDVFPVGGALQDRVADHRAAVAVLERRAVRRHVLLVHDAVEQVVDLVDHRVLPPDDVTVGPPVRHEGVVAFADDDLVEALGLLRLLADPEDIELVQVLEVELDRALLAADLEAAVVLPARGEARRLEGADRAALELDERDDVVVDVDLAHLLRVVRHRTLGRERPGEARDGLDLADEEPGEVDQVGRQVAERAGTGLGLVVAPDPGHAVVRHPPLLEVD